MKKRGSCWRESRGSKWMGSQWSWRIAVVGVAEWWSCVSHHVLAGYQETLKVWTLWVLSRQSRLRRQSEYALKSNSCFPSSRNFCPSRVLSGHCLPLSSLSSSLSQPHTLTFPYSEWPISPSSNCNQASIFVMSQNTISYPFRKGLNTPELWTKRAT